MDIPKSISPDPVRDSIVEIRYESPTPFEVLVGIFYKRLEDRFAFIAKPQNPNIEQERDENHFHLNINLGNKSLFYNDLIKIELRAGTIVFNYNPDAEGYIGWEKFFHAIQTVLNELLDTGEIKQINRVGVRYISEFDGVNILEKINGGLYFSIELPTIQTVSLRTKFSDENFTYSLMVSNELNRNTEEDFASLIDIDVFYHDEQGLAKDIEALSKLIGQAHQREKELFFKLITREFLNEFDVKY